jgi:hypothetical protein
MYFLGQEKLFLMCYCRRRTLSRLATLCFVLGVVVAGCRAAPSPSASGPPTPPLPPATPVFSPDERARIVAYWSAPGRYVATAPLDALASNGGPWQVRLTPDGSAWFLAYQRAVSGSSKPPPTQDVRAATDGGASALLGVSTAGWETWVQSKLAHDRALAQQAADRANAALLGRPVPDPVAASPPPPLLGPIPPTLLAVCGNPPPFARAVAPLHHVVTFASDPNEAYTFLDNVKMRERYAYYRFANGTVALGTLLRNLPASELDALFAQAGMTAPEQRIARAVSRLEGGFETVNTYDTGYVSIGFIQFITGADGRGSLAHVLMRQKTDRPDAFAQDFRAFGMDVVPDAADGAPTLVVVDPSTGAELFGAPAVFKVIDDKRLAAVFQRAGRHSVAFRVAQIQMAKSRYWPADDPVRVVVNGREITGKVSDVIRSEAGMATLFDRKVNRGNIAPFGDVVARVMAARRLSGLADASRYERDIVREMKYRADFLADKSLGQPK